MYRFKNNSNIKLFLNIKQQMVDSDFFKEFSKSYQPKKIPSLVPYLEFQQLDGYKILNEKDKKFHDLVPDKTYIKLINKKDAFQNDKYNSKVIHDGGLLKIGGYYHNGEFKKTYDRAKWTHLVLYTNISKKTRDVQRNHYTYQIKIFNYYIFYQIMEKTDLFDVLIMNASTKGKDWEVELIKHK